MTNGRENTNIVLVSNFRCCILLKAHYIRFTRNFKLKLTWLNEATATSPKVFRLDTSTQPNGKVVLACPLSMYFLVTPEKIIAIVTIVLNSKHLIILFENKPPLHLFVPGIFYFPGTEQQLLMGWSTWSPVMILKWLNELLYLFTGLEITNTSKLLLIKAVSPKTLSTAFGAVLSPDTGCPMKIGIPQPSTLSTTKSKLAARALTACAISTWGKLFAKRLSLLLKSSARASPPSNSVKLIYRFSQA